MLFSELADQYFAKWVAWVSIPVVLILWDVGITSLIAPKAVGKQFAFFHHRTSISNN